MRIPKLSRITHLTQLLKLDTQLSKQAMTTPNHHNQPLFGGAIQCNLPSNCSFDLSDVRPVPDHQEVFVTDVSGSTSTNMLVFEILERQAQVPDDQAAEYFFKDLRGLNDPSVPKEDGGVSMLQRCRSVNGSWDISSLLSRFVASMDGFKIDGVGNEIRAYGCIGQHRVRMSPSSLFAFVKVELCVLRLKHVHTDFLITLSQPMPQEEYLRMQQGQQQQQQQCRSGDVSCEVSYDALSESFKSILESFVILDWNLFG